MNVGTSGTPSSSNAPFRPLYAFPPPSLGPKAYQDSLERQLEALKRAKKKETEGRDKAGPCLQGTTPGFLAAPN
jgi:hypothetical protein